MMNKETTMTDSPMYMVVSYDKCVGGTVITGYAYAIFETEREAQAYIDANNGTRDGYPLTIQLF